MNSPDSIEDLMENPSKFGMPTFDEFVGNRDKYTDRPDAMIEAIDRGDPALGCRQRYYVEHYRVDSLEQAQRIASDMGGSLYEDYIIDPQLRPDGAGGFYNDVTFRSKKSLEKRKTW